MSKDGYTGDKTPQETWNILASEPDSILIDVRTTAEWAFVGTPDLSSLGKEPCFAEWLHFPDMNTNRLFVQTVKEHATSTVAPLLIICRSGQRSIAAAKALTEAGFTQCYNVLEGFEGDKTPDNHRGFVGGWKVSGLPWHQR